MKFAKNEEAVSPVIGVILMVAITVIIAAVNAAFVFGMVGNLDSTKIIAATAEQLSPDKIIVTYRGGQDAGIIEKIDWTVSPDTGLDATYPMGTAGSVLAVGTSHVFTSATPGGYTGKNHVTGVAHFSEGSDQVVVETMV